MKAGRLIARIDRDHRPGRRVISVLLAKLVIELEQEARLSGAAGSEQRGVGAGLERQRHLLGERLTRHGILDRNGIRPDEGVESTIRHGIGVYGSVRMLLRLHPVESTGSTRRSVRT
jgi:hypothetical protein